MLIVVRGQCLVTLFYETAPAENETTESDCFPICPTVGSFCMSHIAPGEISLKLLSLKQALLLALASVKRVSNLYALPVHLCCFLI